MSYPIDILCVGEVAAEYAGLDRMLSSLANVLRVPDLPAALTLLDSRHPTTDYRPPTNELFVLLQAYPGQFAATDVERAARLAPLARWITVLGAWCEGEARSGQPLPGVIRIYWHQAEGQFRRELTLLRTGRRSSWSLPMTAADEERLLAVLDNPLPRGDGLVAIYAFSHFVADYLSDICRLGGYTTAWIDPRAAESGRLAKINGAVAAIFDSPAFNGSQADHSELTALKNFVATMAPAPVIVLANFLRVETVQELCGLGVRSVWPNRSQWPSCLVDFTNNSAFSFYYCSPRYSFNAWRYACR